VRVSSDGSIGEAEVARDLPGGAAPSSRRSREQALAWLTDSAQRYDAAGSNNSKIAGGGAGVDSPTRPTRWLKLIRDRNGGARSRRTEINRQ